MEPVASFNGVFNALDGEYAFSVIDNYPMGPGMCMGLLFACAGLKVKTSHNIVRPEMCGSKNNFLGSVFDKVTGCLGEVFDFSYIFAPFNSPFLA